VNTPTIEDMGKYFVIHRTRFLLYTFARGPANRGWYHLFDYHQKHQLFLDIKKYGELKKTFDYSKSAVTNGYIKGISAQEIVKESGCWSSLLDFTKEEYKEKKASSRKEIVDKKDYRYVKKLKTCVVMVNLEQWLTKKGVEFINKDLCKILDISERTLYEYKEFIEEGGLEK